MVKYVFLVCLVANILLRHEFEISFTEMPGQFAFELRVGAVCGLTTEFDGDRGRFVLSVGALRGARRSSTRGCLQVLAEVRDGCSWPRVVSAVAGG